MEYSSAYQSYLNNLLELTDHLHGEEDSQGEIARDERKTVADIESRYMRISDELQQAKKAVREQYQSVWESCVQSAGLKKPRDQRPAVTPLGWKEAVQLQEQAAKRIKDWFTVKAQQAVIERQKKLREDEARRAAIIAAAAEKERQLAEEKAREERERGNALVEALKRKYRNSN